MNLVCGKELPSPKKERQPRDGVSTGLSGGGVLCRFFGIIKRFLKKFSKIDQMKSEYDLSKMKMRRNPYAARLKKPVSMRISEDVIDYFKAMADEAGVPYQNLINLYLRDCVAQKRKIEIAWPQKP